MSYFNGASPSHANNRHRHGNPVSDSEFSDWFDSDGRLVKEAAMREALFRLGVSSLCRPCLWKFLFEIYPLNSTRRDQRTIDLENRANYLALRQRWQILDKTMQSPETTIHDQPSYLELSDDEILNQSRSNSPSSDEKSPVQNDVSPTNDETSSIEASLDCSGEVCSRCHKMIASGSLSNSVATNSESGFSEASNTTFSSCTCIKSDQSSNPKNEVNCDTKDRTSCSENDGVRCRTVDLSISSENESGCETNIQPTTSETNGSTLSPSDGSGCQGVDQSSCSCSRSVGETSEECGICREREEGVKKCVCEFRSSCENLSHDDEALLKILDFPSRVYAARRPVQLETSYPKARRIVLRDVARTDRNYHYFTHKRNLRKVHRILLTYAMFHPEVGYAQGMNDILARFLVVTDSEVDSYWLFASYMSKKREDFLEHTMMRKVAFVKKLVKEVDRELYGFFDKSDCHDYLFCHRWLLLDFKREFPFEEALRIFEVLNSQYLELNSDRALVVTDKVIAKEFEMDAGETRSERSEVNLEFTFDVFVCVAILTMNSNDICKASDAAGIYGCLNGLSMKMNLAEVLTQAEELFYKYCRQNITRGFAEIDL